MALGFTFVFSILISVLMIAVGLGQYCLLQSWPEFGSVCKVMV